MNWWWSKRAKSERTTRKTNEMLARIAPAVARRVGQWRLIECGRYVNKPILSRALRYLAGFEDDMTVTQAVNEGRITNNNRRVVDPHERLATGLYTIHISGQGEYRFHIR